MKEGFSVSMAHDAIKVEQDGSPPFEHEMLPESFKPDSVGANDRFAVSYHGFTTTHMDALCHFFYQGKMYNGFSRDEVTRSGAGKLSVNTLKDGIFTRAVLMDMPRLLGLDYLPGDKAIYPEDLEAWEKKAGVRVGSGDALLLRTGRWARRRAGARRQGLRQRDDAGKRRPGVASLDCRGPARHVAAPPGPVDPR